MRKIVVAIGGSSGTIYAKRLLDKLSTYKDITVGIVLSSNAIINWELEIGTFRAEELPFQSYEKNDFMAPFASGSAQYDTMVVIPCSMGLVGRIASGISEDLTTRAADVILKERRRLVIVPREAPYNLIHLRNMTTLTEAGAIICPASPTFYHKPASIIELVDTVVDRVLDLMGLPDVITKRWQENS
jgi:flavin prenyltransferase